MFLPDPDWRKHPSNISAAYARVSVGEICRTTGTRRLSDYRNVDDSMI
jgi:hypothetical protein